MEFPQDLHYTKDHEWIRIGADGAVVGITSFAQDELGELVYVDLPAVGAELVQGGVLCVVESTKAASDVYTPISGTVAGVNARLAQEPSLVNSDPYGDGWLVKLSHVDEQQIAALLSPEQYRELINR
jgi:glycine cleavage system H protein